MGFWASFMTTGTAIAKLFILGLAGFLFVRARILSSGGIQGLSKTVVSFTLPCLIFFNITAHFDPAAIPNWWFFPLGGILWCAGALMFGYFTASLLRISVHMRDHFSAMLAFQNAGYIPIPLATALLASGERETVLLYIFLWGLATSPLMWGIGAGLISGRIRGKTFRIRAMLTPPFLATLAGILVVCSGLRDVLPGVLLEAISLAGSPTVPLIMFSLGGIIGLIRTRGRMPHKEIVALLVIKLAIFPLLAMMVIHFLHLTRLFGFFVILQASSPPATGLAVMANYYSCDSEFLDRAIFYAYLISIITIPLFLSIFDAVMA